MLDIQYVPGGPGDGQKQKIFEVLWNDAVATSMQPSKEQVSISKKSIYMDLDFAKSKIAAIKSIWGSKGYDKVFIVVATNLLREHSALLSHVLFDVVKEFIPDMHMSRVKIVVTHEGNEVNQKLKDCIDILRKVFAARIMGMIPGNIGTPMYMCKLLKGMFSKHKGNHVRIFDHKYLAKHHFGMILGVGNSAKSKPAMLVVERRGNSAGPCVAFVGKGVTFDTGGLAIKSFGHMVDMKFDKLGAIYAATVMLQLLEDPKLQHVTFVGAFPFAENAVSADALRPGDVIRSYDGTTVEVLNPDA
jgi:leucyl aminopeptidase